MKTRIALAILAAALLAAPAQAQEAPASNMPALEKALKSPPATGILVTLVGEGSQAQAQGVKVGDVFVSYNGVPTKDIPALNAAKAAAEGMEKVEVVIANHEGERTIELAPGQIGINGSPVEKGVTVAPLPEEKDATFDLSSLAAGPRDQWYAMSLDGTTKAGFEHSILRTTAGKLFLRREVAFDGGEQWGLNHFDVTVVLEMAPRPHAVTTRFKNPLTGWIGLGRARDNEAGREWVVTWPEAPERVEPWYDDLIPTYILDSLASLLPQKEGTCYRFRPLNEGMGTASLPAALVCRGEEEIELGGEKIQAHRWEQVNLGGGTGGTYWIANGRTVKSDYGGAQAVAATKEAALAGLHPDLKVQSAE